MKLTPSLSETLLNSRWLLPAAVAGALGIGWLVGQVGVLVPGLLLGGALLIMLLVLVFNRPRAGFLVFISYCFLVMAISRYSPDTPFGLGMDGLLVLIWLAVIFHQSPEFSWRRVQNDLCKLALAWLILNVLELGNPAGASPLGWFYEMRGTTLYWFLTVTLASMLLYRRRDVKLFLVLVISFSVLGALYAIKQKALGVTAAEQAWLDAGAAQTHIIWGQLRIFSFYAEAAQFGASQAHIGLVCLILALGPYIWWKRALLAVASFLLLYGMLISGTRGALFVLVVGAFVYLLLSKQLKILLVGTVLAAGFFCVLKFTYIGNSNANIVRLRTGLDPNDPSFQTRLKNQAILRDYLATRPLGGGVGSIGIWGKQYNPGKFLSEIPPDSYFVKVWAEYGIIGFLIWIGIMLYILGKCCGIVWNIRDPSLRQQLLALTAGFAGILVSSYGNEVMNQMPSAMIVYISWVLVFRGPEFDAPAPAAAAAPVAAPAAALASATHV